MKVKATKTGFFNGELKKEGDPFECTDKEFSKKWMEKVDGRKKAPEAPAPTLQAQP